MKTLFNTFLVISLATLTGCPPKVSKDIKQLNANVTTPTYVPFNFPISEITLPAIFVGNQSDVQHACFSGGGVVKDIKSSDSLKFSTSQKNSFEAGLQANLEKELIKAGLSAELAKTTSKDVHVTADKIKITQLSNLADVTPDFTNAACNIRALEFYTNSRTIITGALKADRITVETKSALTSELKTQLDAALKNTALDLKIAFASASSQAGQFRYTATDVYFGAFTTQLAVIRCSASVKKVKIIASQLYVIDKDDLCADFKLRLTRSQMSNDFTVEAFPESNPQIGTGQKNVKASVPTALIINDITLGSITIDPVGGDEFNVEFHLTIVGPKGGQVLSR